MKVSTDYFKNAAKVWGALPPQKVEQSIKNSDNWKRANVDAIISMSHVGGGEGRSSRQNKQTNYDLLNSRFKASDFAHVLNPYGLDDPKFTGSATKMQNYNIIRQAFETLKGEEMKLGMTFRAVAVNGDAVLEKNKERQTRIIEAIKARAQAIAQDQIDPETGQPIAPDPAEVANSFKTEYAHPTEIAVNKLLKYLTKKDRLQMKFSKGWEHALVSAEEIYYAGIVDGHPSIRVCNPINVAYDKETDNPFIHEGDWAMEERWMPRGAVVDLYGDSLSDDAIRRIDNGELGGTILSRNGMHPGFAYDFNGGTRLDNGNSQNTSHVYVAHCAWRSWRKLGKLNYLDPRTGMVESTTVDDSFRLTAELKEQGATIEWYWTTEIWEGTRIGADEYIDIHPVDNQTGNLPYVGYVYNNVNSVATSLVDMVKAHQYTYIIVWYRLEQELAKAKGKKFLMDLAMLPKSKGWTVDQWMYYFDNLGVAWINSVEEGTKGDPQSVSKFNQFQAIDMTLSQSVGQYMSILNKLEEQVEKITGVSPQRAGDIGASETATGAQRAIIQSTNNTKPLFFYHDMVRETVLQELIEMAKIAYIDGTEVEHAIDEKTVETIKVDAGMLNGTDLGVFMTNSFEDAENLQKLEGYLGVALQYDKANLSDIISILGTKSISEVRDTIVAGERDKIDRDQQASQQTNETQERINQANLEARAEEREIEILKEEIKAEATVQAAMINAEARRADSTDSEETLKTRKQLVEERKLALEEKIKNREIQLKEKALEETKRSNIAKEQISKKKSTTKTK